MRVPFLRDRCLPESYVYSTLMKLIYLTENCPKESAEASPALRVPSINLLKIAAGSWLYIYDNKFSHYRKPKAFLTAIP